MKYYILDMFPYPSGSGLHVGHLRGYTASDAMARFKKAQGYEVMHPMGWDAFGAPAEDFAIKNNTHPNEIINKSIASFKETLIDMNYNYDWEREIRTTDPEFYKHTQSVFIKMYEKGLAKMKDVPVNWCVELSSVLTNEAADKARSEGKTVNKIMTKQWIIDLKPYADRLLEDLSELDWDESIKQQQREWIGKTEGANISFDTEDGVIEVFTETPEFINGAAFLTISTEHEFAKSIKSQKVVDYIKNSLSLSDIERKSNTNSGVFSGKYTKNNIPIYITDHVSFGASMGVPFKNEKDREFATVHNIEIKEFTTLSEFTGEKITKYKMKDWNFSRQRFWGEPIPIKHYKDGSIRVESNLPLKLPDVKSYKPSNTTESPLASIPSWVNGSDEHGEFRRDTNTMPQWAGSSWYYLRYMDPKNNDLPIGKEAEKKWQNVDLYIGGAEHATHHLIYARFWHKFLYDEGIVTTKEPFKKLYNQGMILGKTKVGDSFVWEKMSKSKGNGIPAAEVIQKYGSDVVRLYELALGPLNQAQQWDESGISGCSRLLKRITNLEAKINSSALIHDMYHRTVKKITADYEALSFNTAISAMHELVNNLSREESVNPAVFDGLLGIIAPIAPTTAQALWSKRHSGLIAEQSFPTFDEQKCNMAVNEIPVQLNGKVKGRVSVFDSTNEEEVLAAAMALPCMVESNFKKHIFVPGKIINIIM